MAHGFYCCCDGDDCTEYLIDFDDGTDGALAVASTSGSFTYEDIDGGGIGDLELVLRSAAPGEKLWTVPTTDDDTTTRFEVSAYVYGDGEIGTEQNAGGVVFQLPGVRIEYGIEAGELIHRITIGSYELEAQTWLVTPTLPVRLLISLTPYCDGRTWVVLRRGTEEPPQSFLLPFSLDPFPTEFEGGIYANQDDEDAPPTSQPFHACCPAPYDCYERSFTYTGQVTGPDPGSVIGTAEPAAYSEDTILCSGVSIDGHVDAPNFAAANGYYIGLAPWTGAGVSGYRYIIYCDGGTLRAFAIDNNNCVVGSSGISSLSCNGTTGAISFTGSWPQSPDCPDCVISIAVTSNVTECEAPAEPRAWDDVIFRSCGGAEVPPCPEPQPTDCGECAGSGTVTPTIFVLIEEGGQNCFPAGTYQLDWNEGTCSWSYATGNPVTCADTPGDCSDVHCIGISATASGPTQLSWACGTVGQGCFGSGALYEKSGGGCTSPQGTYLLVSGDGPPSVEVF
jgi:hypothetical protein